MEIEKLNQKVERLRLVTEANMKYLRDHSKLLDQAFEELKEVTESELDIIYDKIAELDQRMDSNGLSK
ncbi:MAG: hypothetical protein AAGF85_04005 [Bacteroidota bacterium]